MASFIQTALRGRNTSIVVDGPLSSEFTKALNEAFAKTDPFTGETRETGEEDSKELGQGIRQIARTASHESQQLESSENAAIAALAKDRDIASDVNQLRIYAVDESNVHDDDIAAFARMAARAKMPNNVVLIAQKTAPVVHEFENEHVNQLINVADKQKEANDKALALIAISRSFNIRTYNTLEAFQEDFMS